MNKHYQFLSLKETDPTEQEKLCKVINDVVCSGWYINGPKVKQFETALSSYCDCENAIGVSNGLDALRLIFRGYKELGKLNDGDEIIVPANTYVASVLAITDCGLKPVFVEPSQVTLNLDSNLIEQAITPRTKALMVVHLYGAPCWNEQIKDLAAKYHLLIVEDNAQSIGAKASVSGLNGSYMCGALGDAAGTSFYPTKNLGALGDAGAVTTNDDELAHVVRALANYGSDHRYHNIYQGINCRLDEIQAAVLTWKLNDLNKINAQRNRIANVYDSNISNPLLTKPLIKQGELQIWHQYVVRIARRTEFRNYLLANGVETDVLYPTPIHKQPCYSKEFSHLSLPITENICDTVLSLPISALTTEDGAKDICCIINRFH